MSKDRALLKRVKILLECMPMEPLQRQADTIIEEIREILAESESEPDSAYREASSLALSLHKKFYTEESPNFELCDSTAGIITQIDNMTCGLMKIPDEHEQKPIMNTRLLELAQQAEESANLGNAIDIKLMMQNYAELIIQDCIEVCHENLGYCWECGGGQTVHHSLKEHFGIE